MNKFIKVDISVIFSSFGFTKVVISAIFAEIPFYESGRGQGWNMGTKTAAIRRTLALAGNSGTQDCHHQPLRHRSPSWLRLATEECCMPWRNPALHFVSLRVALWMTYLVPTAGQTLRMRAWRLTAQLHTDGAAYPHRHPAPAAGRRTTPR